MCRTLTAIISLIVASAAMAQTPQSQPSSTNPSSVPWAVSVVHTIDLEKMVETHA